MSEILKASRGASDKHFPSNLQESKASLRTCAFPDCMGNRMSLRKWKNKQQTRIKQRFDKKPMFNTVCGHMFFAERGLRSLAVLEVAFFSLDLPFLFDLIWFEAEKIKEMEKPLDRW